MTHIEAYHLGITFSSQHLLYAGIIQAIKKRVSKIKQYVFTFVQDDMPILTVEKLIFCFVVQDNSLVIPPSILDRKVR